jgi:peptidoglycan/xylan/chitin deacetylase (PgdA/CDA1 family)
MPIPILCYHKVSAEEVDGTWLNVTPARLDAHIRFFLRRKYTFLRGFELAQAWPKRGVCFTFDDAYVSAIRNAPSLFERHGVRCTFYAVSERVGLTSSWDAPKDAPLAGWNDLIAVSKAGHEIGNHTATHPHLGELTQILQEEEIKACRETLISHGIQEGSFCYPYGSLNAASKSAIQANGYQIGMAIGKRAALPTDDRLALPRIVMAYRDSTAMLLYKLHVRPKLK